MLPENGLLNHHLMYPPGQGGYSEYVLWRMGLGGHAERLVRLQHIMSHFNAIPHRNLQHPLSFL
jgi:hypothetical protein